VNRSKFFTAPPKRDRPQRVARRRSCTSRRLITNLRARRFPTQIQANWAQGVNGCPNTARDPSHSMPIPLHPQPCPSPPISPPLRNSTPSPPLPPPCPPLSTPPGPHLLRLGAAKQTLLRATLVFPDDSPAFPQLSRNFLRF